MRNNPKVIAAYLGGD
ncbi:hypothetical protein [Fournierella sp.]